MKRRWSGLFAVGILFVAATSRSDGGSQAGPAAGPVPPTPIDEPITGQPFVPTVNASATPPKDPFAPYDIGDPAHAWTYQQLTSEQQQWVDLNSDTTGWDHINDAFMAASREQAQRAAASAAAAQLGTSNLASVGVVP